MEIRAGYKKADIGIIPSDWEVKTLGDVGEVKMCRRVFNHETSSEGTIPFYKIGTFGKEADAYISEDLYNSYRQRFSFPKEGNILISAAGTIGRTLIYDGKPAYFQDSNIVWIDNRETLISNNFLYHVFQIVKYNTEGGTIQRLYNSILKSTKFLCPPTQAEQTAIATALNDTDALIIQLEKLIAKKKAIKQGAMQELLTGKRRLVGFEQKKGFKKTEVGVIPSDWEVLKLGEICSFENGDRSSNYPAANEFVSNGIPFINAGHVSDGIISLETMDYIPDSVFNRLSGGKVLSGDILFCLRGSLGKFGLVSSDFGQGAIASSLVIIRPKLGRTTTLYLSSYFKSEICKRMIEFWAGGAAQPNLGAKELEKFLIPLSSKAEQTAIANVLSDMDAEIEALRKKLDKYKMLKQGMMQNLLTGKIRLI